MGIAKVALNNEVLIDVSEKTVTSSNLLQGNTALDNAGENVVGKYSPTIKSLFVSPTEEVQAFPAEITLSSKQNSFTNSDTWLLPSCVGSKLDFKSVTRYVSPTFHWRLVSQDFVNKTSTLSVSWSAGYKSVADRTTSARMTVKVNDGPQQELINNPIVFPKEGTVIGIGGMFITIQHTSEVNETVQIKSNVGFSLEILPGLGITTDIVLPKIPFLTVGKFYSLSGTISLPNNNLDINENFTWRGDSISFEYPEGISMQVASSEVTISYSGSEEITYDLSLITEEEIDGYKPVTVHAIPADYVGSNIVQRDGDDISITTNTGVVNIPEGYYDRGVGFSLPTQSSQTIQPSTSDQIISAGKYLTGDQTIKGDSNLTANNIVSGVSIFGVEGTYEGVIINNQNKSVEPSENQQQINADAGYTGLGTVTVGAIPSDYVGGGISHNTSSDLIASGSTITIPSGYYSSTVSKSIAAGTAFPPATTITTNPTIELNTSTGVITASYSGASYITPTVQAGYISQGTSGVISVTGINTYSLSLRSSTDAVVSGNQVRFPAGYYSGATDFYYNYATFSSPSVALNSSTGVLTAQARVSIAGYTSSGAQGGTFDYHLNTKSASTWIPGPTSQIIDRYQWLTGSQTITGDPNLIAGNIKSGISIFGVQGTYETATNIQSLTITPSETSQAFPPAGVVVDGYLPVTVNAIPSNYVGSNIVKRSGEDIVTNGPVVSIPAGYYSSNITQEISKASVTLQNWQGTATPAMSLNANTGVITASINTGATLTPTVHAGYLSSTDIQPQTVGIATSSTLQLPTLSASIYTPTTTVQTISAGVFLTGDLTILGDSNLVASNIASGVTIFGVTGTLSAAPPAYDGSYGYNLNLG